MSRNFGNKNKKPIHDDDDEMDESTSGFFGNINGIQLSEKKQLNNRRDKASEQESQQETQPQQQQQASSILGRRGAAKKEAMAEMAAQGGAGVKVQGYGNRTILPAFGTRVIASEDEWKNQNVGAREEAEKKMLGILKSRYLDNNKNSHPSKKKGGFKAGTGNNKAKAGRK